MNYFLRSAQFRQWISVVAIVGYVALGIYTQLTTIARVNAPKFMEDYDIFIQAFQRASKGMDPYEIWQAGLNFLYPPPSLFVIGIYGAIPWTELGIAIYLLSNLVALAAIVAWVGSRYHYSFQEIWWWFPLAFGFAPFLELLYVGQINVITEFGVLLMFIFAETVPFAAGFGLWLASVTKLTPIAYFVYLVVGRYWRALTWTILILASSFVVSTLVFGVDTLGRFFQVLSSLQTTFYGEFDSQALIPIFIKRGWLEQGAWLSFQDTLNFYGAVLCLASAALAWRSRQMEPLFIVLSFATTIVPSNLWYNRYVLLLLPILVWMASSRFNTRVIAWCMTGLFVMQLDRQPLGQGLIIHLWANTSLVVILGWQFRQAFRAHAPEARAVLAGLALALALIVAMPLSDALALNTNLIAARDWVQMNLPSGSRIAYDATAPPIKDAKFTGRLVPELVAQSPDWYERNGFEYLVFSSETFGRALVDPSSESARQYASFFERFPRVALFQNGAHEIRIYQTHPARMPVNRLVKRFGIFTEWLEFVGYNVNFPRVELFWRVVQSRRESIVVTVRLLDRLDRLVEQVTTDLFTSDERWQQEMVSSSVRFLSPHPVGIYKMNVELEGRVSGGIPVLSPADEYESDHLIIDPVKVPPVPPAQTQLYSALLSNARFGDRILLLRYSLETKTLSRGESLKLRLYWSCESKVDKDYTVFVHLVDSQGNLVAQTDSPPIGGSYPTSSWDAGEMIPDSVELVIPRDLASGEYRVEIGMYDASLVRLEILGVNGQPIGDHLLLDTVIVK